MNVESLKSELQQVLDNDLVLRKEFNILKRSLSDYRNQLIMRDEDCKRLQVTIDVLNTKLVVVERDCNTYKGELASFKELRGTIQEQLQSKQEEIEQRLAEIQALKDDLNTLAAGYEEQIEKLKSDAASGMERLKHEHQAEIEELKTNIHYKETGIRDEYENRVSELSMSWADKEQSLLMVHEEAVARLKESHAEEINSMNEQFISQLTAVSSGNHEEVASLKLEQQTAIMKLEEEYQAQLESLRSGSQSEIEGLRKALDEQRDVLTADYNTKIGELTAEFVTREAGLVQGYEEQINGLKSAAEQMSQGLTESFTSQIGLLKGAHQLDMAELTVNYEKRISDLVMEYEEKLSNTLIHSNNQNSKLNEELSRAQHHNEYHSEIITSLNSELQARNTELADVSARLGEVEFLLRNEAERCLSVTAEFEQFRQNALLSSDEKINELNNQIVSLNHAHSEYVQELHGKIESLGTELGNMSAVFEKTTNNLSETELSLELKSQELEAAAAQIESLLAEVEEKDAAIESVKSETEVGLTAKLKEKETEYEKLLVENANLIEEIDIAQDKVEAQEAEIQILKAEIDEIRSQSLGKAEYFKETLSAKNFEITNLEANNAAYLQEISQLKNEVIGLEKQLEATAQSSEGLAQLQHNFDQLTAEKHDLLNEIGALTHTITSLNESALSLNDRLTAYEAEIETLKSGAESTRDEYTDRLYKQIDILNSERMSLLDEKDQLAQQLLKMNEVIGSISQQVDSEQIDVGGLNNHRKNVILATNSEGNQGSPMKKQINELVREIDKCIALLSA